jgi:hypothetical protein
MRLAVEFQVVIVGPMRTARVEVPGIGVTLFSVSRQTVGDKIGERVRPTFVGPGAAVRAGEANL